MNPRREDLNRNLTKDTSVRSPVRAHPARGDLDDRVHVVNAAPVDLVDPGALRTECGAAVLEVYTDDRDVTCASCAAGTD
jgi:hypothetical protein